MSSYVLPDFTVLLGQFQCTKLVVLVVNTQVEVLLLAHHVKQAIIA